MVVVLPAPFPPTNPVMRPPPTVNDTFFNTCRSPNERLTELTCSTCVPLTGELRYLRYAGGVVGASAPRVVVRSAPRGSSGRGRGDETVLVGEHDGLHTVAHPELL